MSENINNKATRGSISQIILTALSSGNKYGYDICKDIERLTKGRLILKQPSLYSSLRRMEEQGLISSYWEDSSLGGKRHYYALTEKGKLLYEQNKTIWDNQEELLNNLPKNIDYELNEEQDHNFNNTNTSTLIGNQETLFNLSRNNETIKKIDSNQNINKDEDNNKSFLQFDFFEQNIKFVKESSDKEKNQDISTFTNKFSEMDNHSKEIEPDTENKSDSLVTKPILHPIQNTEIKRQDVFIDDKIIKEIPSFETNKYSGEIKEMENNQDKNEVNLFEHILSKEANIKENTNEDVLNIKNDNTNMEETVEKLEISSDEITWENNNLSDPKNELFENKDYKGLIGRLYNNSQLKDPYEQNKYHTFKEIFPSSQLKEKEKQSVYRESALDAIVESNTNSNIDCDDIKMLNNLYNLQGINIKIHSDIENKKQNKVYTDKNKLNMICAWLISILMITEVLGTFFILDNQNLIARGQAIIYYLGVAITLSYCLILTLENIFDRFKLSIIERKFNKIFVTRLLIFIIAVILIFALNLAFGMSDLMQVEFLSYWLIPTLLSSNILVQAIIYELLFKSKAFNS